jgi:hypothetical protein
MRNRQKNVCPPMLEVLAREFGMKVSELMRGL